MKKLQPIGLMVLVVVTSACQHNAKKEDVKNPLWDTTEFETQIDGQEVSLYTLRNEKGMTAYLTNFGARLIGLEVPDQEGKATDVVLGIRKATDLHNAEGAYFGPIVGPFGNRIAEGKFSLGEETYQLSVNNGPNTLHGGFDGVHFAVWEGVQNSDNQVVFSYTLPDGKEGFPGNISMKVTYSLGEDNEMTIDYEATTDKETIINLTNHAYFNLNGEGASTILDHELQIFADQFTPVDSTLIPTGELRDVKDSPFDFTDLKSIGRDIDAEDEQLAYGKGYDHNFVLNGHQHDGLNHAAKLIGDLSGIVMDIYTKEPGIQFYSGNFMSEKVTLKNGKKDAYRSGLCLEPQHFPDSPNQPHFPSTVLKPGDTYQTKSVYKFTTAEKK